jgi:trans-aconitate methyltransferase
VRSVGLFLFAALLALSPLAANDWSGASYSDEARLQLRWADRFFFQNKKFEGNEAVLDIGCGDGRLTGRIAALLPCGWVIGIDQSESMVQAAHRILLPNLSFLVVDGQDSHFYAAHPETFDLIVAFHSVHWMEDQQALFRGVMTALKPNGCFLARISSDGFDPVQEIADRLIQSREWEEFGLHFSDPIRRLSKKDLTVMIEEIGLEIVRLEATQEDDLFEEIEPLKRQIASWLPHIQGMSQRQKQLFLDELVGSYLDQFPPDEEGKIHLYDSYLEVEAYKPSAISYYRTPFTLPS